MPAWTTEGGVPHFLRGISVEEPPPPGTVSAEEEERLVETRKEWELVLLRREFSKVLDLEFAEAALVTNPTVALKVGLSEVLSDFGDEWTNARDWLNKEFGTEGPKVGEDSADIDQQHDKELGDSDKEHGVIDVLVRLLVRLFVHLAGRWIAIN